MPVSVCNVPPMTSNFATSLLLKNKNKNEKEVKKIK
jgi:hypothetical protein